MADTRCGTVDVFIPEKKKHTQGERGRNSLTNSYINFLNILPLPIIRKRKKKESKVRMNEKTKENKNRSTTCITLNDHELNSSRYSSPKTIYLLYLHLRKGLIAGRRSGCGGRCNVTANIRTSMSGGQQIL